MGEAPEARSRKKGRGGAPAVPGLHSPIAPHRRPSGSRRSPRVAGFRPSGGDPKTHLFKAAATTSTSRCAPRGPPPRLPRPRSLQPLANRRGVLRRSHPLCLLRPIRAQLPRKPRPHPPPLRAPLSSSRADAAPCALGSRRGVLGGRPRRMRAGSPGPAEREATPRACARVPIRRAAGRWLRAWERRGLRHRGCPGGRLSKPPLWAHLRRQPRRSGIVPAIFPSSGSRLRDTASHRGNPSRPRSFPGLGIPERPARGRRVLRGPVLLTGPASLGLGCSSPPPGVPAAALPPAAGSAGGGGERGGAWAGPSSLSPPRGPRAPQPERAEPPGAQVPSLRPARQPSAHRRC